MFIKYSKRAIFMTEESLKLLSVDELCTLMMKAIDDYLLLEKMHESKPMLKKLRADLRLIHKVIADKKNDEKPIKEIS